MRCEYDSNSKSIYRNGSRQVGSPSHIYDIIKGKKMIDESRVKSLVDKILQDRNISGDSDKWANCRKHTGEYGMKQISIVQKDTEIGRDLYTLMMA